MIQHIKATDLNDAWFQSLVSCYQYGREYTIQRGSFETCKRKQLDLIVIEVNSPWARPIIPTMPEGSSIPAPTDMNYVNDYLSYIMEDMPKDNESYTYGTSIKRQIPDIIKMLRETPQTNQACITVGSPDSIFLKDPECLRLISFKVIDSRLNMTVFFRSWDLFCGMPSNLAALQLFKEYICDEIGIKDGKLIAISDGLHLYDYQYDIAKSRIGIS